MDSKGISSDSKFGENKIAELPGVAAPGPHHFARVLDRGKKADHFAMILDRGMKADRRLEWLEKASPQTQDLKNR